MDEKATWGRDLPGKLSKNWPRDEAGEYIAPALLKSCSQQNMEDVTTVNMLEAFGIACMRTSPRNEVFSKTITGTSAMGVDIYVPETMLEDAKALLEGEPLSDEEL